MSSAVDRFRFIGHALAGDGPFRPSTVRNGWAAAGSVLTGETALVRYPRESDAKFAGRNELAFYTSPLSRAVQRFVGYLFARPPSREIKGGEYARMADDIDGQGNTLNVWFEGLAQHWKARGSVLVLVDMPRELATNRAQQIAERRLPVWTVVLPESLTDFSIGEDGKFDFAEFSGTFTQADRTQVDCTWRFDRTSWAAKSKDKTLDGAEHGLGECPLIIGVEGGKFPHFGPMATIADLSRRLFNMDSELDEILRGQTFSLLTMEVPKEATEEEKLAAAKTAGETVGTANMLMHPGSTPAFIAPPSGPAEVYLKRIQDIRGQIDDIALTVHDSPGVESGEAKRLRFQAVNGELAKFAGRLEDFERRLWDVSRRWLSMTQAPTVAWPRDYNMADVTAEVELLRTMRDSGMPREVLVEQQKRIISVQFAGLDEAEKQLLMDAVEAQAQEPTPTGGNVVALPDRNAGLRSAITNALGAANAGA